MQILDAEPLVTDTAPISTSGLVVTRVTNTKSTLTKTFQVNKTDPDGPPERSTLANVYDGVAEQVECADLYEFRDLLVAAKPQEAFAYGVTGLKQVQIVTKKRLASTPGAIARSRDHFHFRAGALVSGP